MQECYKFIIIYFILGNLQIKQGMYYTKILKYLGRFINPNVVTVHCQNLLLFAKVQVELDKFSQLIYSIICVNSRQWCLEMICVSWCFLKFGHYDSFLNNFSSNLLSKSQEVREDK